MVKDIKSRCRCADPHRGIVNFNRRQFGDLLEINDSPRVACAQPDADQEIGTAGKPRAHSAVADGLLCLRERRRGDKFLNCHSDRYPYFFGSTTVI